MQASHWNCCNYQKKRYHVSPRHHIGDTNLPTIQICNIQDFLCKRSIPCLPLLTIPLPPPPPLPPPRQVRESLRNVCAAQVAAASLFLLITFSQHAIVQQQQLPAQTTRVSERVGFEIEGVNSRFSRAFFACNNIEDLFNLAYACTLTYYIIQLY